MLSVCDGRITPAGSHGITIILKSIVQWAFSRPALYGIPSALPWLGLGETHYREPTMVGSTAGRAATLALGTRRASLDAVGRRRSTAHSLLQALEAAGLIPDPVRRVTPPTEPEPGYLRLPVLLPKGIDGFPSVRRAKSLGLAPGYPTPLTELAPLRPFHRAVPPPCPGAEFLSRRLVTVPTHSLVNEADRERIVREMGSYGI